jgi:hypothetical protein
MCLVEFIETALFTRQLLARAGDSEPEVLAAIENDLLKNPQLGDLVRGLHGVRKGRTANPARQKGKRGGFRYFYYYFEHRSRIYLLYLLDKGEREDLTAAERELLRRLVAETVR